MDLLEPLLQVDVSAFLLFGQLLFDGDQLLQAFLHVSDLFVLHLNALSCLRVVVGLLSQLALEDHSLSIDLFLQFF